ncbi:MATE family efflux transporter, partial [Allorhizocola rhizosphaerae]|uniref:MATE family efflux transporter n=1 Tax=Allorhizocola rhizosphaerae TaxID=1872709 RepID=UPI001FE96B7E
MRQIARLAIPAFVILAAEPLYVLVDTAVVGHLGSQALAALAVGGTILTLVAWLGTVLAYGTTGRSARRFGAGDRAAAITEGVQASWLALSAGVFVAIAAQFAADPLARALLGSSGDEVAASAAQWLRVAALGAPGLMLATAGNGWLRGIQDTRRPLSYVVGAFALSAALCPLFVYTFGLGLVGSAIANAVAQTLAGLLFVRALVLEHVDLRPRLAVMRDQLVVGRDLILRGLAFQACFLSATAVVGRFSVTALA